MKMFYESLEALGQGLKLVVKPMNRDILLVGGGKRKLNNGNSCVNKFLVFSAGNGFKIVV